MKKNTFYMGWAVLSLLVMACSKGEEVSPLDSQERVTMIDPWTAIDQTPYMEPAKGEGITLVAGATLTKSTMTVDDVHAMATVSWLAGDGFKMYGWNSGEKKYYYANYSTAEGGDKATFTTYNGLHSAPQHCIFAPASTTLHLGHNDNDGGYFGVNIPVNQTAVAGKVKDEYLYSYAQTNFSGSKVNLDGDHQVTFRNMLAYVRFKMSGDIASSVTSVTLTGASPLAGDCTLVPASDGTPQMSFTKKFSGDVQSLTVTLTGTFAPDTYYYFAVAPGTQSSFSLKFSGSAGSTTKIAAKSVVFSRGAINDMGTIELGDHFTDPVTPSMETIQYMEATAEAAKPVTIAIIPDGFVASEMPKYELLARSAMNTLFNVEPFKTYKNYFNVYILKVASNESGANVTDGNGNITEAHDCYFGSKWGASSYSDMAADLDKIESFVSTNCPDIVEGKHTINEVPVLVIINDTRYGGRCHAYSNGFAYCMAPYTYGGGGIKWSYPEYEAVSDVDPALGVQDTPSSRYAEVGSNSGNWLNTMVHEFGGHSFSRLTDEYWNGTTDKGVAAFIESQRWDSMYYNGVAYGLNVSVSYTNPGYDDPKKGSEYIKDGWQHLLDKAATLPSSDIRKSRIGVYQGAGVSILNRWRSERISCMIDNRFYFSAFQRELIVKRILSLAGEVFDFDTFWAKDVAVDPVRDVVSSSVMGDTDPVPPRPMPLLLPPVLHTEE